MSGAFFNKILSKKNKKKVPGTKNRVKPRDASKQNLAEKADTSKLKT
jgi:hypothetical protein